MGSMYGGRWVRLAVIATAVAVPGCGGAGDSTKPAAGGAAAPVARQQIEKYVTEFDGAQAGRLFGESPTGVDPRELVGRWTMQLNTTLGIIDARAPDGGGPVLEIVRAQGETFVLRERECPGDFTLQVRRTGNGVTFSRRSGRCDETIDLLVEQSWRSD